MNDVLTLLSNKSKKASSEERKKQWQWLVLAVRNPLGPQLKVATESHVALSTRFTQAIIFPVRALRLRGARPKQPQHSSWTAHVCQRNGRPGKTLPHPQQAKHNQFFFWKNIDIYLFCMAQKLNRYTIWKSKNAPSQQHPGQIHVWSFPPTAEWFRYFHHFTPPSIIPHQLHISHSSSKPWLMWALAARRWG